MCSSWVLDGGNFIIIGGSISMADDRVSGTVKWFSSERGYGFIIKDGDDKNEYFTHYSYIIMDGYKTLKPGQKVTFKLVETEKGIQAQEVIPE